MRLRLRRAARRHCEPTRRTRVVAWRVEFDGRRLVRVLGREREVQAVCQSLVHLYYGLISDEHEGPQPGSIPDGWKHIATYRPVRTRQRPCPLEQVGVRLWKRRYSGRRGHLDLSYHRLLGSRFGYTHHERHELLPQPESCGKPSYDVKLEGPVADAPLGHCEPATLGASRRLGLGRRGASCGHGGSRHGVGACAEAGMVLR